MLLFVGLAFQFADSQLVKKDNLHLVELGDNVPSVQQSSSASSAPENQRGMNIVKCLGKKYSPEEKKQINGHLPDMQPEKGTHPAPPTPPCKESLMEFSFGEAW